MITHKTRRQSRRTLIERVIQDMIEREESSNLKTKAKKIKNYLKEE